LAGRVEVVAVTGGRPDLQGTRGYFETTVLAGRGIAQLVAKSAQPAAPVDAYLVLVKTRAEDQIDSTNQLLEGVGLYRRHLSLIPDKIYAYLVYHVFLVDAQTAEVLGSVPGGVALHVGAPATKRPYAQIDPALWSDDLATLGPERSAQLLMIYDQLLAESLSGALQRLGFLPTKRIGAE
jgi:hypothetical protein